MILLLDNYDSFTYNVWHLLGQTLCEQLTVHKHADNNSGNKANKNSLQDFQLSHYVMVQRNDALTVKTAIDYVTSNPYNHPKILSAIILSPGPATPQQAGISLELILAAATYKIPLLGICLGLQSLVVALGGEIATYQPPKHGKVSTIQRYHPDNPTKPIPSQLLNNLPLEFSATRYHSIAATQLPKELTATAYSQDDAQIMALEHQTLPLMAVQFHPESYYSQHGKTIIGNFLKTL